MVKQIKCINTKSYALTEGKTYIVLKDTTDMYFVENDKNKAAKYSKKLFEDIKENIVEEVRPEPIEEDNTVEDYFNRINIVLEIDNHIDFDISYVRGRANYSSSPTLQISDSTISCGVRQISNINALKSSIIVFSERFTRLNAEQKNELSILLLTRCFEMLSVELDRFIIMSTNEANFGLLSEALDSYGATFVEGNNPSSGNNIRIWTLPIHN